jgi:hypothetical protein
MLPPSVALLLLGGNLRRAGREPGPAVRFEDGFDGDFWPLVFRLKVVERSVWLTLTSQWAYQQLLEKSRYFGTNLPPRASIEQLRSQRYPFAPPENGRRPCEKGFAGASL